MRYVYWQCDYCGKQTTEPSPQPPAGWIETSWYDQVYQKFRRMVFCCNQCAIDFLENRIKVLAERKEEANGNRESW